MTIYLLYMAFPLILFVFLELFEKQPIRRNEHLKTTYIVLAAIIMTLMIGLRHPGNGSVDTMRYCLQWDVLTTLPVERLGYYIENTDLEAGYIATVWLLSHIFPSRQWLLLISGLFFSISVCFFVKRNCKNMVLALTVFNCLGLFNFMVQGLRQSIAMCICLWAIEPCKNRKLFRFLLLVGLAMQFHASAVVFVIVYLVGALKFNQRSVFFFAASAALAVMLLPRLVAIINTIINDDYGLGSGSEEGGWIAVLISFSIILFGLLFRDKQDAHYPFYVYMAIIGLVCMLLRQSTSGIIERVSKYFTYAEMVVVANGTSSIRNERTQIFMCMAVFVLCFLVAIHKASYSDLIPYMFFWQTG